MKRIGKVRVVAFAVGRCQPAAFLRRLALIVRFDHRRIRLVPRADELRAALLDPTFEIGLRDRVRPRELRARWGQDRDR